MSELFNLLEEGIQLLNKHNVKWVKILITMKEELIKVKSKEEMTNFLENNELNIYGGMGSLYDIFICQENGNVADNFKAANGELENYRERLSKEWHRLKEYPKIY